MPARILDGTKIAQQIRREVAEDVNSLAAAGVRPGLAVVLVGHNPASEIYVRGKVKACEEVGIYSEKLTPPESASTADILRVVEDLDRRDDIDGILVQLPLPPQVDSKKILLAVDPAKDVDGFHPMNVGLLSTQRPGLVPCTPAGVLEILKRSNISIAGQEAVVPPNTTLVAGGCNMGPRPVLAGRRRAKEVEYVREHPPRPACGKRAVFGQHRHPHQPRVYEVLSRSFGY